MELAVIAAMASELKPLRERTRRTTLWRGGAMVFEQAEYNGIPLLLAESGIGKGNAAVAAALVMERYAPKAIINVGTGGGFSPRLAIGDIVVGTQAVYSDVDATCFGYQYGQVPRMPEGYVTHEALLERARAAAGRFASGGRVHFGQTITSDSFMSDPARVKGLKALFPDALAADMEGTAIAQAAFTLGGAYINIRGISDIVGEDAAASFNSNVTLAAERAMEFFLALLVEIVSQ